MDQDTRTDINNNKKRLWLSVIGTGLVALVAVLLIVNGKAGVEGARDVSSSIVAQTDGTGAPIAGNPHQNTDLVTVNAEGDPLDCLACHPRTLTYHDKLGQGDQACYICHVSTDATMRNIHLLDGTAFDFTDSAGSAQLCGQCHQQRYAAWLEGTHGIPGTIAGLPCADCHNPHKPEVALLGITNPPLPPLDYGIQLPRDIGVMLGITIGLLFVIAVAIALRRENQ